MYGFSHFWQFMWGIMWKRTKTHQKVCWIFFVAYLVLLIYFMFFSDGFGRAPHVEYAYNLVLFKEIKRFYIYRDIVGTEAFVWIFPADHQFEIWKMVPDVDSELPSEFEHRDDSSRIQGGKF